MNETNKMITIAIAGAVLLATAIAVPIAWYQREKVRLMTEHGYVQKTSPQTYTSPYWTKGEGVEK